MEACGECLGWPDDLTRARAPFLMEAAAARLVRGLKYSGWTALAARMGAAMAPSAREVVEAAGRAGERPWLVPVPLSAARRRRRGFNQARLLAASLGRETGWPAADALRRGARGRRQARLDRASRLENVRGAFRAAPPRSAASPAATFRGDRPPALIVDDVVTTGSTAAACAGALASAGWRPAGAVAFARAVDAGPAPGGREEIGSDEARSRGWWHTSRDG